MGDTMRILTRALAALTVPCMVTWPADQAAAPPRYGAWCSCVGRMMARRAGSAEGSGGEKYRGGESGFDNQEKEGAVKTCPECGGQ